MAKILLVEDDNNLREIYEARLQAEGYTIVSARDGEEALVVAKAEHPDLVISDVMMPKISGFEMLDIMRNTEGLQHVKVIMLTALGQSEDQKRADSLGADRYLVKSQVTLEDIVNVSQALLQEAGAIEAPEPEPVAEPAPVAAVEAVPAPPVFEAVQPAPAAVIPMASEPVSDAVAVVPEPIITEPVADVPVAPAPETVAAPPVADAPAMPSPTPLSADEPQSTAQEEATVQQQIETFVAGQSGDAPSQVEPVADEPVAVEPEVTAPETPPQQEQVVTEAAHILSGEPEPTADQPVETPAAVADDEVTTHKKIIQPITDTDPDKKSLDQLLQEEAARESGTTVAPAPATPPAPKTPSGTEDFDPNSIAL